jgi:cobyrinic acid a,c-diamide synthase
MKPQRPGCLETKKYHIIRMQIGTPRLVLAALKGGAGKTFLSVGLVAALRRRGLNLSVFKKGPDYIDAGWLSLAAGGVCYNLDPYLFEPDIVLGSFIKRSQGKDLAIVEGNRGLFDGVDSAGSYSTAELAKTLKAPLVLIIDVTKMTRTAAALVLGCKALDTQLNLRAVILNRVGGSRHERVLTQAIESSTGIPVIGAVGKLSMDNFPQRHLGLLPQQEHPGAIDFVKEASAVVENGIDLNRLLDFAGDPGLLETPDFTANRASGREMSFHGVRIGVIRDSAFQFYYPENLEALQNLGAEIVFMSALTSVELPDIHALYIGGGFPETHAERLAGNSVFKKSLLGAVRNGLPVYSECGGLMYLCRSLCIDDKVFPMVGVFPVDTVLERKPQGLGYIKIEVVGPNPFYLKGQVLTGHEFHYSTLRGLDNPGVTCAFRVLRGHGIDGTSDGLCNYNALGTYLHLHASGEPHWAEAVLTKAAEFKKELEGIRIPKAAGKDFG